MVTYRHPALSHGLQLSRVHLHRHAIDANLHVRLESLLRQHVLSSVLLLEKSLLLQHRIVGDYKAGHVTSVSMLGYYGGWSERALKDGEVWVGGGTYNCRIGPVGTLRSAQGSGAEVREHSDRLHRAACLP